ncbi:hypothetical protein GCM10011521_20200 [Arenimonas soli]|uniref:Uncharacterized protein n=1 Tax=Arenimonas soli TaxID=2269504 RepID=A0ABQ1HM19_9GAMM|nr:hypothetical protein [Arenimonas soli]GGA81811.1 hypothetical protein GCM10011521_20200 [Arenimonas soli]
MSETPVSRIDRIVAHRLVIGSLPACRQWGGAISLRGDGSAVEGVAAVVDALRMDLLGRIGDIAHDEPLMPLDPLDLPLNATGQDVAVGIELTLNHLPRRSEWERAIADRNDGTTVEGVFSALCEIRRMLHKCLGECPEPRSTTQPTFRT